MTRSVTPSGSTRSDRPASLRTRGPDATFTVPDTLRDVWDAISAVVGICSLELETAYEATLGHQTTPEEGRVGALDREAIGRIQQYAAKAQGTLITTIERDLALTPWEQLLADPTQQLDKDGEVAASILAAQRLADIHSPARCPHRRTTTHPPGTAGANPVTVCDDCGLYL